MNLLISINVVTWMPETSCFRTPFRSQGVHVSQTLLKSARQHFYPNSPIMGDKLGLKTSLLVRSEILGLIGNTLLADHMYSRHHWENFPQHVQAPLSEKTKFFIKFLLHFGNLYNIFVHFDEKDQLHRLNILEVIDWGKCGYLNAGKLLF